MKRQQGRRRRWRYRKPGEVADLERAFSQAWAQRAWDPARHETPCGVCFPDVPTWRRWLRQAQARYPGLELRTLVTVAPVVLVIFIEHHSREWLPATVIDELLALARSNRDEALERRQHECSNQPKGGHRDG